MGAYEEAIRRHPSEKFGDERICPNTGTVYRYSWSESAVYDSCDQCSCGPLPQERLAVLNRRRRQAAKAKEQVSGR